MQYSKSGIKREHQSNTGLTEERKKSQTNNLPLQLKYYRKWTNIAQIQKKEENNKNHTEINDTETINKHNRKKINETKNQLPEKINS